MYLVFSAYTIYMIYQICVYIYIHIGAQIYNAANPPFFTLERFVEATQQRRHRELSGDDLVGRPRLNQDIQDIVHYICTYK